MNYDVLWHTGDLGVRRWGESFESLAASAARMLLEGQTDPRSVRIAEFVHGAGLSRTVARLRPMGVITGQPGAMSVL